MAVWSQVTLSEVELTRLDAEFYKPEYLIAKQAAGQRKLKSYGVIVLHPAEFSRRYSDGGDLILLAQNNRENYYDWSVQQRVHPNLSRTITRNRLEFGDVTITRTGANFGQTSVIGIELEAEPVYACADLLILRSQPVDGHLIATYLNTRVGRLLLDRGAYGAAQPHIAPNYIREIPFPEVLLNSELEVRTLVLRARKLSKDSNDMFGEAQRLLESKLGLDKLRFEKPVGYTTRLSELEMTRRFDPEHFYPEFDFLKSRLPSTVRLSRLGGALKCCQRGKQPIYTEHGLPVLNSKHILENKITLEGNRRSKSRPSGLEIQYGDVLINGTGRGTIGRAAPYLVSEHHAVPDNHVTILRSPTVDPAYLSFFLNSLVGRLQVEKHQRGSSGQLELYPFDIRKFLIWEAPQSFQSEIRRLYDCATECARGSRDLLEEAKARVEQLIEEAVLS